MTTKDAVLVGTDGSQPALAAVRWAAKEAERRHAELRVLHAFDENWAAARALRGEGVFEIARNRAEEIVADSELAARAVAPGLTIRRDADIGDPADILVEAADSAALVVVGSRGRSRISGLVLGSVGQQVATRASCPVVVVRAQPVAVGRHSRGRRPRVSAAQGQRGPGSAA